MAICVKMGLACGSVGCRLSGRTIPSEVPALLPLRLVFIPERRYWCVVRGRDWYQVTNESDLVELLSVLRAAIVKSKQLEEFPAIRGHAAVEQIRLNECVVF